jgi:RimJ/RimL family protein N-acetyltransferase
MQIEFRKPTLQDVDLYFQWANDEVVRQNSFDQERIVYDDHVAWFKRKLTSADCFFYLFVHEKEPVGQVRIEVKPTETVIGISIDSKYRGKGLGATMLEMACTDHFKKTSSQVINAYIKENNISSIAIFKKAGFKNEEHLIVKGVKSVKLNKAKKHGF